MAVSTIPITREAGETLAQALLRGGFSAHQVREYPELLALTLRENGVVEPETLQGKMEILIPTHQGPLSLSDIIEETRSSVDYASQLESARGLIRGLPVPGGDARKGSASQPRTLGALMNQHPEFRSFLVGPPEAIALVDSIPLPAHLADTFYRAMVLGYVLEYVSSETDPPGLFFVAKDEDGNPLQVVISTGEEHNFVEALFWIGGGGNQAQTRLDIVAEVFQESIDERSGSAARVVVLDMSRGTGSDEVTFRRDELYDYRPFDYPENSIGRALEYLGKGWLRSFNRIEKSERDDFLGAVLHPEDWNTLNQALRFGYTLVYLGIPDEGGPLFAVVDDEGRLVVLPTQAQASDFEALRRELRVRQGLAPSTAYRVLGTASLS